MISILPFLFSCPNLFLGMILARDGFRVEASLFFCCFFFFLDDRVKPLLGFTER